MDTIRKMRVQTSDIYIFIMHCINLHQKNSDKTRTEIQFMDRGLRCWVVLPF